MRSFLADKIEAELVVAQVVGWLRENFSKPSGDVIRTTLRLLGYSGTDEEVTAVMRLMRERSSFKRLRRKGDFSLPPVVPIGEKGKTKYVREKNGQYRFNF